MARIRDYRAEEQRRNELAKQRGFTSRAQQRHRIERGKFPALAPERLRKPETIKAQKSLLARVEGRIGGPFSPVDPNITFEKLAASKDKEELCEDWSAATAGTIMARFDTERDDSVKKIRRKDGTRPDWISETGIIQLNKRRWIKKHGRAAYIDAYYEAFVDGPGSYQKVRNNGGSDELRLWLVDITRYLTEDEYEARYGRN